MSKRRDWTWKTADPSTNARLHLKYEPGNWGDVLKGAWLVPVARETAKAARGKSVRYLDSFAGAPSYPLLDASARRLELLPDGEHLERLKPYAERGEWPSCALLARDTLRAYGAMPKLLVFDSNLQARELWAKTPDAEVLALASGEDAFERRARKQLAPDLVLLDSYDFFDRWGTLLTALESFARGVPVLVYIYNSAPRGPGFASQYERLRKKLTDCAKALGPIPMGRLPYDKLDPLAYHEVLLLAPHTFTKRLLPELRAGTEELARRHADAGAFEVIV